MTFEKFEKVIRTYRPDIYDVIPQVGEKKPNVKGFDISNGIGIIFKHNGRCFTYRGTYSQILCSLKIEHTTNNQIATAEAVLADLVNRNGKPDDFYPEVICDYTEEIENQKKYVARLHALPNIDCM